SCCCRRRGSSPCGRVQALRPPSSTSWRTPSAFASGSWRRPCCPGPWPTSTPPSDQAPDTNDTAFAGCEITAEITVVTFAVRGRHQDFHIPADDFLGFITEKSLRRAAKGLNDTACVDDDHPVRDGVENGSEMRLAGEHLLRGSGHTAAAVMQ